MKQTFFKMKFEDKTEIDYGMFREINEIVGKIRFEGYGKILAPRYEYYTNGSVVNDLENEMYLSLHILHGDEEELLNTLKKEINNLGYNFSYNPEMPNSIEIFYNVSQLNNQRVFEKEFKSKIKECDGIINDYSELREDYDSSITFSLQCEMNKFEDKINEILKFLNNNIGNEYFIEYF